MDWTTLMLSTRSPLALALPALLAPLALTLGCGENVIPLDGVSAETVKDGAGVVTEVALRFDLAKVEAVREAQGDAAYFAVARLPFDDDAAALGTTVIGDVGYASHGHGPPGLYDRPHFDVHFYGIAEAELLAIDCSGETEPAAENVPPGYVSGGAGEPPFGACIKEMGVHFGPSDPADATKPLGFDEDAQLVIGFTKGKLIFFEPMIPEDIVLSKTPFSLAVPRPQELGRAAQWPTSIDGAFDEDAGLYRIAAKGFTPID
jgi:hypothetical protein